MPASVIDSGFLSRDEAAETVRDAAQVVKVPPIFK
jgi:hypothetical protein